MRIKDIKNRLNKNKKQALIDYVRAVKPIEFENVDSIDELDISKFEDDIKAEINDILDKTYPQYMPFYIYNMELKNEITIEDLKEKIEIYINQNNNIDIDKEFALNNIYSAKNGNVLSIEMVIEQYKIKYDYKSGKERGDLKIKENLKILLSENNKVLLINTGTEKYATIIYNRFLLKNFHDYISITPIRITPANLTNIKTNNIEDDKVTIFMLELLSKELNNNPLRVNDYYKVGISTKGDSKIKNISVKGSELLHQEEIYSKLTNGFRLKNTILELEYQKTSNLVDRIKISLVVQSTLKIVIIDGDNEDNNFELIYHIIKCCNNVLNREVIIQSISSNYFYKVQSKKELQMNIFINEFKKELLEDKKYIPLWKNIEELIRKLY